MRKSCNLGFIFVSGNSPTSWILAYNGNGQLLSSSNYFANNMQNIYQIGQQTSSRLIVAGLGALTGSLYAYTSLGALDTEFGSGTGMVSTGITSPIATMAINNADQIIIGSVNGGNSVIQKVSLDGTTIANLTTGTPITNIKGNEIKLALDPVGNIVVAAALSTGFKIVRYTSSSANSSPNPITINLGTASSPRLGALYTTSDGSIVVIGCDTNNNSVLIARINANFMFDTNFNNGSPLIFSGNSINMPCDGYTHIDNRLMISGTNSLTSTPSLIRVFGDNYVAPVLQTPTLGMAGFVDQTCGLAGAFTISSLGSGLLNGTQARSLLPLPDGGYYIALNNGTTSSKIIRTTSENNLNPVFGNAGIGADSLSGVNFMMINGFSNLVLVGTNNNGMGWVSRYNNDNSGTLDTTFNTTGSIVLESSTTANIAGEQTLARLLVAGQDSNGKGIVRAFTNLGNVDTTFNALVTPGIFSTGTIGGIYAMSIDQYDRIIIAYKNNNQIDVARLNANGVLDKTFGVAGIVSGILMNADQASQVRLVINKAGNIVVAAHTVVGTSQKVSIVSCDNLSALSGNGAIVNGQSDISGLINPILLDFVATQDGNLIALGSQSGSNPAWIARLNCQPVGSIALDNTFNANGSIPGILTYAGSGIVNHTYNACSIRPDGRISMIGNEDINPTLVRIYNNPYVIEGLQSPNAKPVGTNDMTLGLTGLNGVTFFAASNNPNSQAQYARAVGLQDKNNVIVALDGKIAGSNDNYMFLNMFDVNGIANQNFGTAGKITLPHNFQAEYVQSMYSFTTAAGVNKAILVGYAKNPILNISGSLVMQYNVMSQSPDSSFGGLNGNPTGVVFGDGMQANTVARQSSGRIIVAGSGLNGNDMLLGYTPTGSLDTSFGVGGYVTRGTNPLFTQVIDNLNRIIVAYNDGNNNVVIARILANGSGLDTTFGNNGQVITKISGIIGNSNMRVALDNNGKIIVAAVNNFGMDCVVNRYLSTGAFEASLTMPGKMFGGLTNFILSKLLIDMNGKIILVGSDNNATQNKIITARIASNLSGLDTTFNQVQTPGYIKYSVASGAAQGVCDAMIHPDGRIILVGAAS